MCKYCEVINGNVPTEMENGFNIRIYQFDDHSNYYLENIYDEFESYLRIEYCMKCGKTLK